MLGKIIVLCTPIQTESSKPPQRNQEAICRTKLRERKEEAGITALTDRVSKYVWCILNIFCLFSYFLVCRVKASLLHCASYKIYGNGLGDTGKALSDSLPFLQY